MVITKNGGEGKLAYVGCPSFAACSPALRKGPEVVDSYGAEDDEMSTFTANFDFSRAAAMLALACPAASGTRYFKSRCVEHL